MASFYQSVLQVSLAVIALGAAVLAAAQQLVITQTSAAVGRLPLRSRWVWFGVLASVLGLAWVAAGALLLATKHDIVPGYVGVDRLLADPVFGALGLGLVLVGGLSLGYSGVRALSLLDLETAGAALVRRIDPAQVEKYAFAKLGSPDLELDDLPQGLELPDASTVTLTLWEINRDPDPADAADGPDHDPLRLALQEKRRVRSRQYSELKRALDRHELADPLASVSELAERSANSSRSAFGPIIKLGLANPDLLASQSACGLSSTGSRRLVISHMFENHLRPLAQRLADEGKYSSVAILSRVACDALPDMGIDWAQPGIAFSAEVSQYLLRRRAAQDLASVVRDLASYADGLAEQAGPVESAADEICRALGRLGQQLPALLLNPSDPEVHIAPNSSSRESDAMASLIEAFSSVKHALIDRAEDPIDSLIWRDAVMVSAGALRSRARAYADDRLEGRLLQTLFLLSELGADGARTGDSRKATIAAYALGDLSKEASDPNFHEYAADIAMGLAEIGLFATVHGITSTSGDPLATWVANALVESLRDELDYPMHEVVLAGRFEPADHASRWAFVKLVGTTAHSNFGFRFDPASGDTYPPEGNS